MSATSRTAFLVLGHESSGTKLMMSFLKAAGCHGDVEDSQAFDGALTGNLRAFGQAGNSIMWRRSLPHFGRPDLKHLAPEAESPQLRVWPDLDQLLTILDNQWYSTRVLVTIRTHYCAVRSQLERGHVRTTDEAEANIVQAMERIIDFTHRNHLPTRYFTFESMIFHPEAIVAALREWGLQVDPAKLISLRDVNEQYLPDIPGLSAEHG